MITKKKYEVVLHQVEKNEIKKSILFLFKNLFDVEIKYWATKLKIDVLIWAFIKFSQYFDDDKFIVVIDHIVFKSTLQTKIKNQRSAKLKEWFMFLFQYLSRMNIVHRFDKTHQNTNDFFRLFTLNKNILFVVVIEHMKETYSIVFLNVDEVFRNTIKDFLSNDSHFNKIYHKIQQQINEFVNNEIDFQIVYQFYRLDMKIDFLYFVNKSKSNRVCISIILHRQLFHFAHDSYVHNDINRFLNWLKFNAYMSKMKKFLKTYIDDCLTCQLSKFFRQLFFNQLHFVEIYKKSFVELFMNFIVELSMTSNEYNCLFTMTNRFFKYVRLILEKKIWNAKEWVNQYHQHIYRFWKLSTRIITNRNSRFVNDFWTFFFQKFDVKLELTIAYHVATNEQNEKTNQIVKTTIRCLFINKYEKNWFNLIAKVKYALNTTKNVFINIISFELLYEMKSREMLSSFIKTIKYDENVNIFIEIKNQFRNEIYDVIKLTQTKMTVFFDKKHKVFEFIDSTYIKLIKVETSKYHMLQVFSFSTKKIDFFRILKKMNELTYKLKLSNFMKIHDTIFVIHLKSSKSNSYVKLIFSSSSIVIENNEKLYVIEKILRRKTQSKKIEYHVKWKKYDQITFEFKKRLLKNVSKFMNKFEKSRFML